MAAAHRTNQLQQRFQQQVSGNSLYTSLAIGVFVLLYLCVDVQTGDQCWEVPENDQFFEAMTHLEPVRFKNPAILSEPDRYRTSLWQALEEERQAGLIRYDDHAATKARIKQLLDQMIKPRLVERTRKAEGLHYHSVRNGFLDRDIIQEDASNSSSNTKQRIDLDKVCIIIRQVVTSRDQTDFGVSFQVIDLL